MKSKINIILFLILISLISFGCKSKDIEDGKTVDNIEIKEDKNIIRDTEVTEEKTGIPSPLSGMHAVEEKVNRRPVAIMLDNHPGARWQAGLKDAEIVYEFLVEFPYTRYMGIYLINDPESVGPIRSARPYFISTCLEYDAVYVHVGGSEQAKKDIRSLNLADIDGLSSSKDVFWRKSHKKAPNNTYSSMEVLRNEMEKRSYRLNANYTPFKFKEDESNIDGENAEKILINYAKGNTTEYNYVKEEKIYKRFKDGELHIDENDNTPIIAKNIIIQKATTRVIDNKGRLSVDLEGNGEGIYITNGNAINIKWLKPSGKGKTLYYMNDSNNEIILNPGVTWIQIVQNDTDIVIE